MTLFLFDDEDNSYAAFWHAVRVRTASGTGPPPARVGIISTVFGVRVEGPVSCGTASEYVLS